MTTKGVSIVTDPAHIIRGLQEVAECLRGIEHERTEQLRVREESRIEVKKIRAIRDLTMAYLDRSFDERRENFRALFERLDRAIEKEDAGLAATILESVTKLAESSPFKNLRDVASARAALSDRGTDWEF